MKNYEKPMIFVNEQLAEGIYAASGTEVDGTSGCDSKYMKGVYHPQNYQGNDYSNMVVLGCTGCPAFRANGCGLQVDQAYLDGATSYDVDNGNRMPEWEKNGKDPNANYWE